MTDPGQAERRKGFEPWECLRCAEPTSYGFGVQGGGVLCSSCCALVAPDRKPPEVDPDDWEWDRASANDIEGQIA